MIRITRHQTIAKSHNLWKQLEEEEEAIPPAAPRRGGRRSSRRKQEIEEESGSWVQKLLLSLSSHSWPISSFISSFMTLYTKSLSAFLHITESCTVRQGMPFPRNRATTRSITRSASTFCSLNASLFFRTLLILRKILSNFIFKYWYWLGSHGKKIVDKYPINIQSSSLDLLIISLTPINYNTTIMMIFTIYHLANIRNQFYLKV